MQETPRNGMASFKRMHIRNINTNTDWTIMDLIHLVHNQEVNKLLANRCDNT